MPVNKTIAYYNMIGSRLGYSLVAGGHRHFGYYGKKNYRYIPNAAVAMIDYLAKFADIKKGERVLDAGCGEGRTSFRIAEKYGAVVTGIDVVPRSIKMAKRRARKSKAAVDYQLGDYNRLKFKDETFDLVFTLETFTHSPNPQKTLKEFLRVLKPGGRIVIFDYTVTDLDKLSDKDRKTISDIARLTDCPSFDKIFHDFYDKNLPRWGMPDYTVGNLTKAVKKSLDQIYILSYPAYLILKALNKLDKYPNILISHYGKLAADQGDWHYVTVKINKPALKLK